MVIGCEDGRPHPVRPVRGWPPKDRLNALVRRRGLLVAQQCARRNTGGGGLQKGRAGESAFAKAAAGCLQAGASVGG